MPKKRKNKIIPKYGDRNWFKRIEDVCHVINVNKPSHRFNIIPSFAYLRIILRSLQNIYEDFEFLIFKLKKWSLGCKW